MPQLESRLLIVTDRNQTNGRPLLSVLEQALSADSPAVQLREKDLSTRDLCVLAHEIRMLSERRRSQFVINDRVDIALTLEDVGVHLRGNSFPAGITRRLIGTQRLLGVSTHRLEEAVRAESEGADYVVFGPIYPTPSKQPFGASLGLHRLEEVCRSVRIPVLAIGGITAERAPDIRRAGAFGAAVIGAVCSASAIEAAVRELLAALSRS